MRVVSTLPSATEMLYALGVEPVAVSHECDFPPDAETKPSVTKSEVDVSGDSVSIAREVGEGAGVHVDFARLRNLDPDVVVAQDVCPVCAVDAGGLEAGLRREDVDVDVVRCHAHDPEGVFEDLLKIGETLDVERRAEEVVAGLRLRLHDVFERAGEIRNRERALLLDWMEPVMVAGHWVPWLFESLGYEYGLVDEDEASAYRDWDSVVEFEPDLIVVAPCGYDVPDTLRRFEELTGRDGWEDLPAVERERVYVVDGSSYVNRPGPRIVDSVEILASIADPELHGPPPEHVVRPMQIR
ncbi:MAG: ABC transporter substrate-binding protein [Halobacteriales archaeon]